MWGLATNDVLGTLGLGVVLALVIRHRVAFRVAIVPCILTVFLLGVLLHSGSCPDRSERLVWACCCGLISRVQHIHTKFVVTLHVILFSRAAGCVRPCIWLHHFMVTTSNHTFILSYFTSSP
jgi:hypothetical protein